MNFLVVDRKGSGDNLVIESLDKEELYYSIFCLASETDRLEYVLSSDDAN